MGELLTKVHDVSCCWGTVLGKAELDGSIDDVVTCWHSFTVADEKIENSFCELLEYGPKQKEMI